MEGEDRMGRGHGEDPLQQRAGGRDAERPVPQLGNGLRDREHLGTVDDDPPPFDGPPGHFPQHRAQPHLLQRIQSQRHQPFAAECPADGRLPLQQPHADPVPGQQQGQGRTGRAGPHDDDVHGASSRRPFPIGSRLAGAATGSGSPPVRSGGSPA
nr:hypothetical protein [Pseudonocardia nigra]